MDRNVLCSFMESHSVAEHLLQFSLHGLLNFSLNSVLNNNFHSPMVYSHLAPNTVLWLPDMFSCLTQIFFWQEIVSLDKFWFCGSTQNTFKPLVWHLFHQNILIINDFMKVYEKLIIFMKSLIFNIFWWKKCLTISFKVFWVDLQNQNLSKINISWIKIFQLAKNINENLKCKRWQSNLGFYDGAIKFYCFLSCFLWLFMSDSNIFIQEILILDKFWFCRSTHNTFKAIVRHFCHQNMFSISDFMKIINFS